MLATLCGEQAHAPVIFILGAPRTGSTFFYQMLASAWELPYVSNLVDQHYPTTPIVGLSIQASMATRVQVNTSSQFGKTDGLFQPSEGSGVMQHWCGGEHPSQSKSARVLAHRAEHCQRSVLAAFSLFGRPLVIKNAWNCFRIKSLATLLPDAYFIWIRRSLERSAKSDLSARYLTKSNPTVWNSATPSNIEELRERPYWEQVVENQVQFNLAVQTAFAAIDARRHAQVWYEDLCASPNRVIAACLGVLTDRYGLRHVESPASAVQSASSTISQEDAQAIERYVADNWPRLSQWSRLGAPSQTA